MAISYIDPKTNIQYTDIPQKTFGISVDSILTQSNVRGRRTAEYLASSDYYSIVSSIDIYWNKAYLPNIGEYIETTADLLYQLDNVYKDVHTVLNNFDNYALKTEVEALENALAEKANINDIPKRLSQFDDYDNIATKYYVNNAVAAGAKDAYQIAVETGYVGTKEQWIASLHGVDGQDGLDAFQLARKNGLTTATSVYDWIQSLQGSDGYSAYDIARQLNPEIGTPEDWIASLKGETGTAGADGKNSYQIYYDFETNAGRTPLPENLWLESLKGENGKSAYEIYRDFEINSGRIPLEEEQWITQISNGQTLIAGDNIDIQNNVISAVFRNVWEIIEEE